MHIYQGKKLLVEYLKMYYDTLGWIYKTQNAYKVLHILSNSIIMSLVYHYFCIALCIAVKTNMIWKIECKEWKLESLRDIE